jgi:hypothetical protein
MAEEIFESDAEANSHDPDETPIRERRLVTQPIDYSLVSLVSQIKSNTIFLRPISDRPRFQRNYVWSNTLASRLIESILLSVPIPPCFFSQNEEYELDVIDGQQRLFSIYRFLENQYELNSLEVISEINGLRFHQLPSRLQKQLNTFSIRCVIITNESHPEIKFEVFERLNTNTVPLNAQELRNCVYRGKLNEYLKDATEFRPWLEILGKRHPDVRLRDEELVLRYFAYQRLGILSYRTPQKHWLNEAAKIGRSMSDREVERFKLSWENAISVCRVWFNEKECFRKRGSKSINKALFDIVMQTASKNTIETAIENREAFRDFYFKIIDDEEFSDHISRAIDHKRRVLRRFAIWNERGAGLV